MDFGLQDRVILVTGGAAGIGAGIVQALADEGALAVVVDRDAVEGDRGVRAELTRTEDCRRP